MKSFAEKIYEKLKEVPRGRVTTYKGLAVAVGSTAYRAAGQAMRHNPFAPDVPCHRVVNSDGKLGGFKGKKSGKEIAEKIRLLTNEGVKIVEGRVKDFETRKYSF